MHIRVAVLADYASISENYKLNILGIFAVIFARAIPFLHGQMQLVCQLEFDPEESGPKELRIVLRDEDGRELLEMEGMMQVPRSPSSEKIVSNQILCLNNVRFEQYGTYEFLLLINGEIKATVPLRVIRPPAPPTTQASKN